VKAKKKEKEKKNKGKGNKGTKGLRSNSGFGAAIVSG